MKKRLTLFAFIAIYTLSAQSYHFSLEGGALWQTPNFHLNYKAIPNDDLKVMYADGSQDNRVEHYQFSNLRSAVAKINYQVNNPRKRGTSLVYSTGLGYAQTSFLVEGPESVFSISKGYVIIGGQPRDYRYKFDYLIIPLGVSKHFKKPGKTLFFSLGANVSNYLLVSKKGEVKYEGNDSYESHDDGRLASARDYLMTLDFDPSVGVALGREQKLRIALNLKGGVSFFNVLKKEESLFREIAYAELTDIKMYEETKSLNTFYGFSLSLAYRLE